MCVDMMQPGHLTGHVYLRVVSPEQRVGTDVKNREGTAELDVLRYLFKSWRRERNGALLLEIQWHPYTLLLTHKVMAHTHPIGVRGCSPLFSACFTSMWS